MGLERHLLNNVKPERKSIGFTFGKTSPEAKDAKGKPSALASGGRISA